MVDKPAVPFVLASVAFDRIAERTREGRAVAFPPRCHSCRNAAYLGKEERHGCVRSRSPSVVV
jgi:hypothetical protein